MTDELRDRIARALWERECEMPRVAFIERPWDEVTDEIREAMLTYADAVIAALGLREVSGPQYVCDRLYGGCPARQVTGRCEHVEYFRRYVTPWERIEDGA